MLLQGGVVALLELPGRLQAGLQRHRLQRGQEHLGYGLVDGHAADAKVPGAAAVDHVAGAGAVVAGGGLVLALVVDGELAAAGPAGRQALQQGAAFADGAGAGLMAPGAGVGGQLLLVGLIGLPADVALVVTGQEHLRNLRTPVIFAGTHHSFPDMTLVRYALARSPSPWLARRLVAAAGSVGGRRPLKVDLNC